MNIIGKRSLASVLHLAVTLGLAIVFFVFLIIVVFSVRAIVSQGGTKDPNLSFSVESGPLKVDLTPLARSGAGDFPWLWVVPFAALTVTSAFVILLMLRRILASLKRGEAFEAKTPGRLRVMGCMVILSSVASSILWGILLPSIERLIAPGSGIELHARLDTTSVFQGLVLLVLAEVFKIGARLRLENDLTV